MNNIPIYLDEINCNELKKGEEYIVHDPNSDISHAKKGTFVRFEYLTKYKKGRAIFSKTLKNRYDTLFAVFNNLTNYNNTQVQSILGSSPTNKFSCFYIKFYKSKINTMSAFTELILKEKVGDKYFAEYMTNSLYGKLGKGISKSKNTKKQKTRKKQKQKKIKNII